jgi:hypothetical protein
MAELMTKADVLHDALNNLEVANAQMVLARQKCKEVGVSLGDNISVEKGHIKRVLCEIMMEE